MYGWSVPQGLILRFRDASVYKVHTHTHTQTHTYIYSNPAISAKVDAIFLTNRLIPRGILMSLLRLLTPGFTSGPVNSGSKQPRE